MDRDGVLIKDTGLISSQSGVHLYEKVGDSIALLRNMGFKIVLVSNQTVVSRGIMTFEEMVALNDFILNQIKIQNPAALFDEVLFSPFHPKATVEAYRKDSDCRKPRSGMLLKAQEKLNINFSESIIIGDRLTDIYAGKSVGCVAIQLLTGSENEALIESGLEMKSEWLIPDHKFKSLYEAATFIRDNL